MTAIPIPSQTFTTLHSFDRFQPIFKVARLRTCSATERTSYSVV
ncbi:MAG TPA: hypothetical protein VME43_31565 [Bryobacteraceae bacterium]|nr:hypothetical protein [Bryobacteraceae bacterium]